MLRLGLVDFDSSHSLEFTRRFNHIGVLPDQWVEGARVVLGWPGSSEMSPDRIELFQPQIEACGVEIVSSPEQMLGQIDAVLILSLSGQVHLKRVLPFLEAGIPAFIDKPFTCSWQEAEQLVELAQKRNTLVFGSSALRFSEEVLNFQQQAERYGTLNGCLCFGPAKRAQGNPGLFHYGIHTCELLFTLMGTGCEWVCNHWSEDAEVVTAGWQDGRLATLRGNRTGSTAYGFIAFCETGVIPVSVSTRSVYRNLCRQIVRGFETNQPIVPHEVTLEITRFVSASLLSEQHKGERVYLNELAA